MAPRQKRAMITKYVRISIQKIYYATKLLNGHIKNVLKTIHRTKYGAFI